MFTTRRIARAALFSASALAQSQYGGNHVMTSVDSQLVEQTTFPAPNVTLLSPAFLPKANATFDPGWSKGTKGATSQDGLSDAWHSIQTKTLANVVFSVLYQSSRCE
jgi:hypothetical protein